MRLILLSVFCLLLFIFPSKGVTITGLSFAKASYEVFEKAEATFTLGTTYANPYDSAVVQADAEITLPGGAIIFVPCFYYIPATYAYNSPGWWVGAENPAQARWMLRFAPRTAGTYQVRIRVLDGTTSFSTSVNFQAVASGRKGFIRIDATNSQFMRFDNGNPYYPVGYNDCWNNGELVNFYNTWLNDRMEPTKINWSRYWFTDFARQSLEWTNDHWSGWYTGLGRYSQRAAGLLDSVINNCERNDIYLQLVLQHHGQLSSTVDPAWDRNPYNTVKGGPIANPGDFFTNAAVRAQTKKLYRYIIARWGYSTNVMCWELFNEVEYADGTDAAFDAWHDEMSHYLKYQDPNNHLVTTSTGDDNSLLPFLDNNAAIDQLQWHTYAGSIEKVLYNQAQTFKAALTKPIICGEFGTAGSYAAHPDNWGDHVRKSMWTGMMNESPNLFWYWDEYIQDKNLYTMFTPLANYLENEDLVTTTGGNASKPRISSNPTLTGTVQVVPSLGAWGGTNTPNPFTSSIDNAGNASNVTGLHRYLHGSFQGTRNRQLSFTVNVQAVGSMVLNVVAVAAASSKIIEVRVDGTLVATWMPTGAGVFTHPGITAGAHTVSITNTGQDWVEFNAISFTNASLKALDAWGYTGNNAAYGYVNNLSYGDWAAPAAVPIITTGELRVGPLTPGSYALEYWNPRTGVVTSGGTVTTSQDSITISLPSFNKDIAFKIKPITLPIRLLNFSGQVNEHQQAKLYWTIGESASHYYFSIQRSDDGSQFTSIGEREGGALQYSFLDEQPILSSTYYRIYLRDDKGNEEYSSQLHLHQSKETKGYLYPNPTSSNSTLVLGQEAENVQIQLYTSMGVPLSPSQVSMVKKDNVISLSFNNLSAGLYFIVVYYSTGNKEIVSVTLY